MTSVFSYHLEALHANERFCSREAVVTPSCSGDCYVQPHNQDLSQLPHFENITSHSLPDRFSVDIPIALDNSLLMKFSHEKRFDLYECECLWLNVTQPKVKQSFELAPFIDTPTKILRYLLTNSANALNH